MAHQYTLLTNDLTDEAQFHDQQLQKDTNSSRSDWIGFSAHRFLHHDAVILMLCKAVRMFGFGFMSVMLAVYLKELKLHAKDIGMMFSLTLIGDAILSIAMTSRADKWGRRKTLVVSSIFSILTAVVFASQSNFWVLLTAAVIGVISPSGNDIGPFLAIELSALSQITSPEDRTRLMAWYNLLGRFSSAIGAIFCGGVVAHLSGKVGLSILLADRIVMILYSFVMSLLCILFFHLSPDIEIPVAPSDAKIVHPMSMFLGLHKSKTLVVKLSALFMLDALGGSFILQSTMSDWFHDRYNTSYSTLGTIVFICNIMAGISALFAAKLAEKFGLILTMVATHLPSNVFLILVPLMPTETLAIVMLCLRFCISEMDSPIRNAYVQGVVHPDERSAANGVTNVARSVGAASGPMLAGLLYANPRTSKYPWIIAGVLKIIYDLLLLYNMSAVKPDVEVEKGKAGEIEEMEDEGEKIETQVGERWIGNGMGKEMRMRERN